MPSTPPSKPIELVFESANDYDNPFMDVDLTLTFRGPSGATVRRPAFWDGGRTWRVRFAPTEPGEWRYRGSANVTDSSLDTIAGTVHSGATGADALLYANRFLRAAATGSYLECRDGKPFFWLGDTHWRFAWESWDDSNKPGWKSQFRDTIDLRVAQGFTVYQSNIVSWSPPPFWDQLVNEGTLDVSYFANVLDPRFAYIADRGLVHAVGLSWYHAIDRNPRAMIRYARYVVARYGAFAMVWTLGGEVAGYEPDLRDHRLHAWAEVARAISDADDYEHPITAHSTNERPLPSDFEREDWFTFTLSQLGHGDLDLDPSHWLRHRATRPGKPLVEGESLYEGLISVERAGRRAVTDTMVRHVAYRAIQSGCCGYSYGAQGCWNSAWDSDESVSMWGDLPWTQGVDLPGGAQMGLLRRFYESLEWTTLRPAPELFDPNYWTNEIFNPVHTTASGDRKTVIVYFGENYRHNEGNGRIVGLADLVYVVEWFNPRTGRVSRVHENAAPLDGVVDVPKPASQGDWLLVLRGRP